MKYWVQAKAPAGNWYDITGTNDLAEAQRMCEYHRQRGEKARVVERVDVPVF